MTDDVKSPAPEKLIARAKRVVDARGDKSPMVVLIKELADALSVALEREEEIRRESFLEGVRSAAKVVREKKEALKAGAEQPDLPEGAVHDEVAERILDIAASDTVTIRTLKDLLARTETASGDLTALDGDLIRFYYALVNRHRPTAADVLPLGRPTASVDVALAMATRLLPEGWFSLGANLGPKSDPATALVGSSESDDPKPRTASTPALALLTAMLASLAGEATGGR